MTERTRTLTHYLEHWAATRPDHPAVAVGDDRVTYAELATDTARLAAGLAAEGVRAGDTVALMMRNSVDMVRVWLALGRIGAVTAPVNTAFRGPVLAHVLSLSTARTLVADADLLDRVTEVTATVGIDTLVVRGAGRTVTDVRTLDLGTVAYESATGPATAAAAAAGAEAGAPTMLLFTSGTTGRSKACVLTNRYVLRQAEIFIDQLGVRDDDVLFCPFPLFHADAAVFTVAPALRCGATAALEERFSVSRFWRQVRHHRATVFDFMGATLAMLARQPPDEGDRDHHLRLGWGVPLPPWAGDFERRFDVPLVEVYGLTDAGIVLYNRPGEPRREGSCGRAVPPFDVRLLDADGFEVPTGQVGEICVRADEPGVLMSGYLGMPEETLAAFHDLWLHTGDLARRDDDGYVYFVGRAKDVIRRRGENISAFEVEEVLDQHPAVLEVAVVGVPSELSEEEVKACVVLRPGHSLDPGDLLAFATARLPRYMVPRYLQIYPELPKTPTEKVEKYRLAATPFTPDTADLGEPPRDEPRP